MAVETDTVTLPASWAPALINGDYSGLSESESFRCREARISLECEGWDIVSCDDERFTRYLTMYDKGADSHGGNVCDYAVIRPSRKESYMAGLPYIETVRVHSAYGAPMGRRGRNPVGPFYGRVRARRVRISAQGYDAGGAYWGVGAPLFYVYDQEGADEFIRAPDNAAAVARAIAKRGHDPA